MIRSVKILKTLREYEIELRDWWGRYKVMLYDKSNTQMLTGNVFSEPMSGLIKNVITKLLNIWIHFEFMSTSACCICMYCVSAIKYNFYYHSSNRIQLTTMFCFFFLLNVMYLSLLNFTWCIKCMFISRYFYLWNLKKNIIFNLI